MTRIHVDFEVDANLGEYFGQTLRGKGARFHLKNGEGLIYLPEWAYSIVPEPLKKGHFYQTMVSPLIFVYNGEDLIPVFNTDKDAEYKFNTVAQTVKKARNPEGNWVEVDFK